MANIGNLAAQVTANATPFMTTMNAVKGKAAAIAQGIGGAFSKMSGIVSGALGLGGIGGMFAGGLAIAGIMHVAESGRAHLLKLGAAARTFGISLDKIRGVELAAGGDLDAIRPGLAKMTKHLGEARLGSIEAARGFQLLGLNAKELSNLPTEQVIGQIGDRLNAIENPFERAAVAAKIFGRGFAEMMPLLAKGTAGIEKADKAANQLGKLTSADLAKARVAAAEAKALKSIGSQMQDEVGKFFTDTVLVGSIAKKWVFGKDGEAQAFIDEMRAKIKAAKAEAAIDPKQNQDALDFGLKVADLEEKLNGERDALVKTASAVDQLADAYRNVPGSDKEVARLRAIERTIEAEKRAIDLEKRRNEMQKRWDDAAKKTIESTYTDPLNNYQDQINQLDRLIEMSEGRMGGISQHVYDKAAAKAFQDLESAMPKSPAYQAPPAMLAGSNEAMQTIQAHRNAGRGGADNAQERVKQVLEQAREYQRQTAKNTADIAEALKGNKIAVQRI